MSAYEEQGYYGSENTPCTIFVYQQSNGLSWYCVEDSKNVNATYEAINCGCNVEMLEDVDTFTSNDEIETVDQLIAFIDDDDKPEQNIESMTIELDNFDNDSMIRDSRAETIRILQDIIKNIKNYGVLNCNGMYLKDINGNTIGNVGVYEK